MKNKTLLALIITNIFIVAGVIFFWLLPTQPKKTIAIVKTLSHPALDMAQRGFTAKISSTLVDYKIKEFNAEGSIQSANLIARQIANDKSIVAILAIASLAAQTLAKAEKHRPIVIVAVSDPQAILPPEGAANLCGLSDAIDADYQISTILDLLPNTKSISLLYSPHETNSASAVKKLEISILSHGLKSKLIGVYEPQQIASASLAACDKSDVVLIPLDNQLAASMPAVIKATKAKNCTVILTDKALIKHGAAIAFGVDYQRNGEEAAMLIVDILKNYKTPKYIGVINPKETSVYVNRKIIHEKNIVLNPAAKTKIISFEEER